MDDFDGQARDGEAESARVQMPMRVGFNFKVRPRTEQIEPAKQGKQQLKKKELADTTLKNKRRFAEGSKRGEAPRLTRLDM